MLCSRHDVALLLIWLIIMFWAIIRNMYWNINTFPFIINKSSIINQAGLEF